MKRLLALVVLAGAAGAAWHFYFREPPPKPIEYRTVTVERGDVLATINATGTVEPEDVVDVGAQVAGKIESLGPEPNDSSRHVDYGSLVEEGAILAQIDAAVYKAQVEQANANLARSEADLLQWKAKLEQAEREWSRAQNQLKMKVISESDFDLARANHDAAQAQYAVGLAAIVQAKASLKLAEINLGYTTIRSPVTGVILDRRVGVGQTVVASLNAPSLFLLAKDLKRLAVWASVNEADIGQVHDGQAVTFTVDTYPNEVFSGSVWQIRPNAMMTQNVVTYTVVIATDNASGKLRPYLTANVRFDVDSRQDVLVVPNAALRWQPRPTNGASNGKSTNGADTKGGDRKEHSSANAKLPAGRGRLWIRTADGPRPIEVKVGLTDGVATEVEGDGLSEGTDVIVGEVREEAAAPTASPFTPRMFGGGSTGSGSGGGRSQ